MSELSQEQIKILEQTRQLLIHLTESLHSFQRAFQGPQLPSWTSITSHNSIVSVHLQAYRQHLSEHAPFLSTLSVYPLPSFPGKSQEILLSQVLRKKLDPDVEEWASQAAEETEKAIEPGLEGEENQRRLLGLWNQASLISNECAKEHSWGADYTDKEVEEGRENVATGLKSEFKNLDRDDEVDEDEQEKQAVRMVVVKGKGKKPEGKRKDVVMQSAPLSQILTRGPPEARPQSQ